MSQPTTVSGLFPSKWLHADDLGTGKIVTISAQRIELMKPFKGDQKEPKLILTFQKASKELIVTKSQAMALADIAGTEEFSKWVGLRVAMRPEKLATGKYTIAIDRAPSQQPAAPAEAQPIQPLEIYQTAEPEPEAEFNF